MVLTLSMMTGARATAPYGRDHIRLDRHGHQNLTSVFLRNGRSGRETKLAFYGRAGRQRISPSLRLGRGIFSADARCRSLLGFCICTNLPTFSTTSHGMMRFHTYHYCSCAYAEQ
jgi:hypothetical protein